RRAIHPAPAHRVTIPHLGDSPSPGRGSSLGSGNTVQEGGPVVSDSMASFTAEQDRQAVDIVRGFAMDAPLKANSGHQGTAMALAPLAHVLYSRVMKHDPADPSWPDRDRFVLSNGHASILQYSMLYLNGYGP